MDSSRIDPTTHQARALPIRIWYPARHRGGGRRAHYLSPAIEAAIESSLGLPSGLFDVNTHAVANARPRSSIRGIVLMTPGWGLPVATLTGITIDLASRGYVVVTVDHPHDALLVEAPDGTLISNSLDAAASFDAQLVDLRLVLDALPRLVPQARRSTPIGVVGHSIGGAAAAELMLVDRRVQVGINLDGSSRGGVVKAGLDAPFGMMLDRDHDLDTAVGTKEFLSNLRGPHRVKRLDVLHLGFTDFVVFNPEATGADPLSGAILEFNDPTGTASDLSAGRGALKAERRFVASFLDCYLVRHRIGRGGCGSATH
ncbi:MAG TPA: alpha/beta fold hydrolase [Candidatus Limnocylindrales bacterium]|nr:alpha/beta fold hydrolase [Candidatus Limnocylindrales bacterium]